METKDLIGHEVYWGKGKRLADIVAYKSGWFTIKDDNNEEHKVRAKDILLTETDQELVEGKSGVEVAEINDEVTPSATSSNVNSDGSYDCDCGNNFISPKEECFKCPVCGKWHRVRLHPKLEDYAKGLSTTPSGRDTVDINDEVASYMRGTEKSPTDTQTAYRLTEAKLNELYEEAWFSKAVQKEYNNSTGTMTEFLDDKYGHLNNGMIRMNLGNLLRSAIKRNRVIQDNIDAKEEGSK